MDAAQEIAIRNARLRKRKYVSSGQAVLRDEATKLSTRAKGIFTNLWHQHGMDVSMPLDEGAGSNQPTTMRTTTIKSSNLRKVAGFVNSQNKAGYTALETEVVEKARKGTFSLFLSILKIIEDEVGQAVPTKYVLRKLSLTLRPGDVPPILDSKDIILSALHFLSSTYEAQSDQLLTLPLIQPTQIYSDMEKRNYEKVGSWKLADVEEKLMRMEDIFVTAPTPYRWLNREALAPSTLLPEEEKLFLMKGVLPESIATRKNRAGEAAARRKRRQEAKARAAASAAAASNAAAAVASGALGGTTNSGSVASVGGGKSLRSSDDDDDDDDEDEYDSDDVVEATIVED